MCRFTTFSSHPWSKGFFHSTSWTDVNKTLWTSRKKDAVLKTTLSSYIDFCITGSLGKVEPLKKDLEICSRGVSPLSKETNRATHGGISEHSKALTSLFHDRNVLWTSASHPPPCMWWRWSEAQVLSPRCPGPSLPLLPSRYSPCATAVISMESCSILISPICFHRKVNVCCPQVFMVLI